MSLNKILNVFYKIYDRGRLVIYTIIYGRRGFYKYLCHKLIKALRNDNVDYSQYTSYLGFTISLIETCIVREFYDLLKEEERKAIECSEKIDYVL